VTGCDGTGPPGAPDLDGRPADGLPLVGPALGTVRVVKRVVVSLVVVVESGPSEPGLPPLPPLPPPGAEAVMVAVGLGGLTVGLPPAGLPEEGDGVGTAPPSVMGQMVVLMAMISVVTWPILLGQSVTVGAQLVTV